ncbi:MAG: Holliday junction resolvase Hjc [Candidatus Aenigmatarchaeota archaeon]
MTYNQKGSNAEREFAELLWQRGFAVVRSAGSGNLRAGARYYSPDVIAARRDRVFAFECKFRKNYVKLSNEDLHSLKEWCARAGCRGFLAWKIARKGWWLLDIEKITRGINEEAMQKTALSFNSFIGEVY